jgi:Cu/Ag efflux pump CusA
MSGEGLRTGGLAAWSIRHPVGVSMIALAVIVLGLFALARLAIDLHPHIIYPEIVVRILNPGVPAAVMEDQVTRQLEEQLAITEDAISVQSRTTEGNSTVTCPSSTARTSISPCAMPAPAWTGPSASCPKLRPAHDLQARPLADPGDRIHGELAPARFGRAAHLGRLHVFSKWFINLPGVAAAEVGGGLNREVQILPDQQRLAGLGLDLQDLVDALQRGNREAPAGRLQMSRQELSGRISGRFTSVGESWPPCR